MEKYIIKSTLLTIALLSIIGCVSPVENVVCYTPPTSSMVSSEKSGIPLKVQYNLTGDATVFRTIYWHIFNKNSGELLVSDSVGGKKNLQNAFGVAQSNILGTIGDKVVFVWRNGGGDADAYLAVHDFSEHHTYNIVGPKEKFSILQKGDSYVVKNLTKGNYISLNNLKEVKLDERGYNALSMRYYYTGLDNRGRVGKLKSVFTPSRAYFYVSTPADSFGKLDKLMFSEYPLEKSHM